VCTSVCCMQLSHTHRHCFSGHFQNEPRVSQLSVGSWILVDIYSHWILGGRHIDPVMSTLMPIASFIYTVSQKTSHLWLAITFTHIYGFWYFLAEMLPIKYAIKRRFTVPPQITCASTLPVKTGKHENHIFHSVGLCYTHNAPVRCLPERKNCHLWCVW